MPALSADERSVRLISNAPVPSHALSNSGTWATPSRPATRTTRRSTSVITPIQHSTTRSPTARTAPRSASRQIQFLGLNPVVCSEIEKTAPAVGEALTACCEPSSPALCGQLIPGHLPRLECWRGPCHHEAGHHQEVHFETVSHIDYGVGADAAGTRRGAGRE